MIPISDGCWYYLVFNYKQNLYTVITKHKTAFDVAEYFLETLGIIPTMVLCEEIPEHQEEELEEFIEAYSSRILSFAVLE